QLLPSAALPTFFRRYWTCPTSRVPVMLFVPVLTWRLWCPFIFLGCAHTNPFVLSSCRWSRSIVQGRQAAPRISLKQRGFEDINECIDASTEKRKRVLIHCRDGYSLAPTCIIQYLMVKRNMRLLAAYEFVRARYPVNIKERHQDLLVNLEKLLRPDSSVDPECFKQAISRKMAWT
uniref:protein-tyrosine-phosphatase n=1 Tax=Erpetoichthys calabaricus TaxID=27687 RepID=A0A8C4RDD2_ERPCA